MGGNALKKVTTRRYSCDEYNELKSNVTRRLANIPCVTRFKVTDAYRTKESFGDMDILIALTDPALAREIALNVFDATEVFTNGQCVSFDYKQFQIDFIVTPVEEFDMADMYYAWNDLGAFIGCVASRMGLSYGHRGLFVKMYSAPTNKIGTVLISRDPKTVLEILGYDYDRFLEGFDTPTDIYDFACASPNFHPAILMLDGRSHRHRIRDRKRQMYHGMLKYLYARYTVSPQDYAPELNTDAILASILHDPSFDHVKAEYDRILRVFHEDLAFRRVINGENLTAITGKSGKELGEYIKGLLAFISDLNLKPFIASNSATDTRQVCLLVVKLYEYTRILRDNTCQQ